MRRQPFTNPALQLNEIDLISKRRLGSASKLVAGRGLKLTGLSGADAEPGNPQFLADSVEPGAELMIDGFSISPERAVHDFLEVRIEFSTTAALRFGVLEKTAVAVDLAYVIRFLFEIEVLCSEVAQPAQDREHTNKQNDAAPVVHESCPPATLCATTSPTGAGVAEAWLELGGFFLIGGVSAVPASR